jgi:hypothetical protein
VRVLVSMLATSLTSILPTHCTSAFLQEYSVQVIYGELLDRLWEGFRIPHDSEAYHVDARHRTAVSPRPLLSMPAVSLND